jgi:hypothetical protein
MNYNIYKSSSMPVDRVPGNLWQVISPTTTTAFPVPPNGEFISLTVVWNCDGTLMEVPPPSGSAGSSEIGVPAPPTIMSVRVSGKLRATGAGFSDPVEVLLGLVPFAKPSSLRGDTLLIQKGTLVDGRSLSDVLMPGKTVLINFRNSDGAIGSFNYTQQ